MRRGVATTAITFMLVACTSSTATTVDSTAAPISSTSTVTPPTTIATTTSTTVATTPSTTTSAEMPILETTGDDWTRIVGQIIGFIGWLGENPNPELLNVVAVPGSPYYEAFRPFFEEYETNGWHDLPGGRAELRLAKLQRIEGDRAFVATISDFDGATTVDSSGAVVKTDPDRPPRAELLTLERGADGRWRIAEYQLLGNAEGVRE